MSNSNAEKMSLEEKLVQTIKSDSLMALVGDEDAITELVTRAVKEALFQPRRITKSYGGYDEMDSPLVAAARSMAKQTAESLSERMIESALKDERLKELFQKAVVASIPSAVMNVVEYQVRQAVAVQMSEAQAALTEHIISEIKMRQY